MNPLRKICMGAAVWLPLVAMMNTLNAQPARKEAVLTVDSVFNSAALKQKTPANISERLQEKEYYRLEDGALCRFTRQGKGKEKKTVLVKDTSLDVSDFIFNADKSRVLLLGNRHAIYRHSATYTASVWTADAKGRYTQTAVLSGDGPIEIPRFSPDGNKVAFVRANNLYYTDLESGQTVAVTADGQTNRIRNGHTDWVYEEEFAFIRAYDWREDSRAIGFLKFDESELKEYEMTMWGGLYPQTYRYKYPKAGEVNSKVSFWVYELGARTSSSVLDCTDREVRTPGTDREVRSPEYMPRIFWEKTLGRWVVYTMNRHQNHLCMWAFAQDGEDAKLLYEERNACYIEIPERPYFFKDGRMLITTERDGYNHLYIFKTDGRDTTGVCLTPGNYDVTALYGVDETNNRVFFQAAYSAPQNREVLCVDLNGKNLRRIALDLQLKGGWTNAWFNEGFTYMILQHSKANQAAGYYLYHVSAQSEQLIECLQSNNHLERQAKMYGFVKKEFISIPAESAQDAAAGEDPAPELNAWIMKPAEIGTPEAQGKRYPVLMFLYGGPGSQQVCNSLQPYQTRDYLWYQMLVQQGYIVVCVDNRGTACRGEKFKKCTYMQLGKYETQDQLRAARYLASLPYVDGSRMGIWGWSYGGFMSSNCLFQGEGVFKMAMAVAPVTHWKFYDNVYTERYMRTPQENPDGYELNSPLHHAAGLQGAYLLVHGSGDDNVHIQNSMELVGALQKQGKNFDLMVYPNKNHSMVNNEGSAQKHLYEKLTRFIHENL